MTVRAIGAEAPAAGPAGPAGLAPVSERYASDAVAEVGRLAETDPCAARSSLYHLVAARLGVRLGFSTSQPGTRYGWSRPHHGRQSLTKAVLKAVPLQRGGWQLRGKQSVAATEPLDDLLVLAGSDVPGGGGIAVVLQTGDAAVSLKVGDPAFDRPGIRNGWISAARSLAAGEVRYMPARVFEAERLRAELLGELLHAALDHGLLRAFALKAHIHLTTRSRPWQGQSLEKATYDPHVIRRYGEYVSILDALTELIAGAEVAVGNLGDDAVEDAALREATNAVAVARSYAVLAGRTLINGTIELLGAGATSEKYGFDVFWRDFTAHAVHDVPIWPVDAIGRALIFGGRSE